MTDDFRGQGLDARATTWDRRDGRAVMEGGRECEVGDVVTWPDVPDEALVFYDGKSGDYNPGYALRSCGGGQWLNETHSPDVWDIRASEVGWTWASDRDWPVTIVAINIPADATADDLRRLAEVFEVREALEAHADIRIAVWERWLTVGAPPIGDDPLLTAAGSLHAAGFDPRKHTAEDAARLLSESKP
jgi:hypothetical protein